MEFTSTDYRNTDFRKEQNLFIRFYYDEISTAPGLTWCTEYFYRRMPEGNYRLVLIDGWDNELYAHEEYDTAERFAHNIRQVGSEEEELDEDYLEQILELCPNDIKRYRRIVRSHFNNRTASLLLSALDRGHKDLVKALLPDFAEIRSKIYPAPNIPGISKREMERRKELLRTYYRSNGYYKETRPDHFSEDSLGSLHHYAEIQENCIELVVHGRGGGNRRFILLEDTGKLKMEFSELNFDCNED